MHPKIDICSSSFDIFISSARFSVLNPFVSQLFISFVRNLADAILPDLCVEFSGIIEATFLPLFSVRFRFQTT